MIEIPPTETLFPQFAGQASIGPEIGDDKKGKQTSLRKDWPGASGLAEVREEVKKRMGHLYSPVFHHGGDG